MNFTQRGFTFIIMSHYKNLREYIKLNKLQAPENFFAKAEQKVQGKLPLKIPVGSWVNISATKQFCVFPYEPVPSALRGGLRMIEFYKYPELRKSYTWRWEYFHDHGDALKVGKSGGLYILDEDLLLVPGIFIYIIYFLIYKAQPQDFSNLKMERSNINPSF